MGRPSKYKPEMIDHLRLVSDVAVTGFTDKSLAKLFNTSESIINAWKVKHPEFQESLNKAKNPMDGEVEASLYQKALGYTTTEVKTTYNAEGEVIKSEEITKNTAPDTTSCIFWLKNRQPDNWKDVSQRVDTVVVEESEINKLELARRLASILLSASQEAAPTIN